MDRWTKVQTESGAYIMRLDQQSGENATESTYSIWLSDFKTLWTETVTSQQLFDRFADKNPTLTMDDDFIKSPLIAALGIVANMKDHKIVAHDGGDGGIDLHLKYSIFDGDVDIGFQWQLKVCGPQDFFDQLTKPFLRQIGELQDLKKQFVEELKKKDEEIGQYKFELGGAEIKRKRFITEPFDENKYLMQTQQFDCEIDQFEKEIGPLPKSATSNESKAADENCNTTENTTAEQPTQNAPVVKRTSPKGKRPNYRRPKFNRGPVIRTGQIKYDDSDDDDNGSNSESNKNTDAMPSKRTRRSSEF